MYTYLTIAEISALMVEHVCPSKTSPTLPRATVYKDPEGKSTSILKHG
jgi:hypothetical protein